MSSVWPPNTGGSGTTLKGVVSQANTFALGAPIYRDSGAWALADASNPIKMATALAGPLTTAANVDVLTSGVVTLTATQWNAVTETASDRGCFPGAGLTLNAPTIVGNAITALGTIITGGTGYPAATLFTYGGGSIITPTIVAGVVTAVALTNGGANLSATTLRLVGYGVSGMRDSEVYYTSSTAVGKLSITEGVLYSNPILVGTSGGLTGSVLPYRAQSIYGGTAISLARISAKSTSLVSVAAQSTILTWAALNGVDRFDTTGAFNLTTGTFTAPRTAKYRMSAMAYVASSNAGRTVVLSAVRVVGGADVMMQGSDTERTVASGVYPNAVPRFSGEIALNMGDTVILQCLSNTGGALMVSFGEAYSATWDIEELPDTIGVGATAAFTGATAGTAGTVGSVPAPAAAQQSLTLLGSGAWGNDPTIATAQAAAVAAQTTATAANTNANGRMASAGSAAAVAFTGSFQNGATAVGTILTRFSRADSFNLAGAFAYHNASSFSTSAGPSGLTTWSMEVDQRILCHAEIDVNSDRRVKNHLGIFSPHDAARYVMAIPVVSYTWADGRQDTSPKIGYYAQDVGRAGLGEAVSVIPQMLTDGREVPDFNNINKDTLLAVLWAANQDLIQRIEKLEGKTVTPVKEPITLEAAIALGEPIHGAAA